MANITTQTIKVDLNTGKIKPIAYSHQNDTARTLVFRMYNDGVLYDMTGCTVKFAYKSPNVNGQYSVITGSSMASGTVSENTVTVTLPAAYTKVSGTGILTMIITPTSGTIRPVNIIFVVEKAADGDDTILNASDWPEGLYEYMDDWMAENEPTEIANLKSDLSAILSDFITEKTFTVVSGEFINNNGIKRQASNFNRSAPIPVTKGERYLMIATGYLQNVAMIATSDADATTFTVKVLSNGSDESVYTYDVEADGYIVVSYLNTNRCVLYRQNIMRGTAVADIDEISSVSNAAMSAAEDTEEKVDALTSVETSDNLCPTDTTVPGFVTATGTVSTEGSFANYITSDFIPVEPNTTYRFTAWKQSNNSLDNGRKSINIFDADKNVVPYSYQNVGTSDYIEIATGATSAYVRVSAYNSRNLVVTKGATTPTNYIPYFPAYSVVSALLGEAPLNQVKSQVGGGVLSGKKWVVCGDSFSNYTDKTFDGGIYSGENATYPRLIAERCGMNLIETFFRDGRTLAFPDVPGSFTNSLTCPTAECYYQNIPADTDYITFYIGINDEHHYTGGGDGEDSTGVINLGTIDDNTTATYYGAWNVILTWLITNRPNAHIGIIVTNGLSIADWRQAQIDIAKKYGVPYIDMNGNERTPVMLRTVNTDIPNAVKKALITKWAVDPTGTGGSVNMHPNWQAHEYESTFVEDFLKSL